MQSLYHARTRTSTRIGIPATNATIRSRRELQEAEATTTAKDQSNDSRRAAPTARCVFVIILHSSNRISSGHNRQMCVLIAALVFEKAEAEENEKVQEEDDEQRLDDSVLLIEEDVDELEQFSTSFLDDVAVFDVSCLDESLQAIAAELDETLEADDDNASIVDISTSPLPLMQRIQQRRCDRGARCEWVIMPCDVMFTYRLDNLKVQPDWGTIWSAARHVGVVVQLYNAILLARRGAGRRARFSQLYYAASSFVRRECSTTNHIHIIRAGGGETSTRALIIIGE